MIHYDYEKIKTENEINTNFISAIRQLKLSKLLNQCGIRKTARTLSGEHSCEKRTAFEIFQFLILMAFQGTSLFRFLGSKKQDIACSKSTYHRFLSNCNYNWRRFITLLAASVVDCFDKLTNSNRFKAFVLDDSVINRNRSKAVELLAYVYDHVSNKTVKGFNLLTLGWTDGFSFIPVAFNMMSSANESKRLNEARALDKRTVGYRNRMASMMQKPDAAVALIKEALNAGISAGYVLMDSWFTNEPFIKRLLDEGLDTIGMLKDNKQVYRYGKKLVNLQFLAAHHVRRTEDSDFFGSVIVRTKKYQIPVKLVFVRNRNKRSEYIIVLSTDCSLSDGEIIRRYGYRWSIECCFKVSKSLLKLGTEFQPVNYDTTVSGTALVFTRFILLEWLRRRNSDPKTLGELFFICCDDIRDIELTDALKRLLSIFMNGLKDGTVQIDRIVCEELIAWYISQPAFIRLLCAKQLNSAGIPIANHI